MYSMYDSNAGIYVAEALRNILGSEEEMKREIVKIKNILIDNGLAYPTNSGTTSMLNLTAKGISICEKGGYKKHVRKERKNERFITFKERFTFVIAVAGFLIAVSVWVKDLIIFLLNHK